MYTGHQKTITLMPLKQIGLAFGVGLFGLVLLLAGRAAFERAQNRLPQIAHNVSHGADRELQGDNTASTSKTRNPALSARTPGAPRTPGIGYAVSAPRPAQSAASTGQNAAQQALIPLHDLLESAQKFDGVIGGAGVPDNAAFPPGQKSEAATGDPALLLDALEAQIALVAHPALFPSNLQGDADEMTLHLRTYLADARASGIGAGVRGTPEQPMLPPAASAHLQQAAEALSRLDALAGGTNPNPRFVTSAR